MKKGGGARAEEIKGAARASRILRVCVCVSALTYLIRDFLRPLLGRDRERERLPLPFFSTSDDFSLFLPMPRGKLTC